MTNSDPAALRTFILWIRRYLEPNARFVLQMHLDEGNDERAAMDFWRHVTGLPDVPFHKTFIKPRGTGHRKNHLEHGVCRVRLYEASDSWNRVMAWIQWLSEWLPDTLVPRD